MGGDVLDALQQGDHHGIAHRISEQLFSSVQDSADGGITALRGPDGDLLADRCVGPAGDRPAIESRGICQRRKRSRPTPSP
jgi:hypothetical protein